MKVNSQSFSSFATGVLLASLLTYAQAANRIPQFLILKPGVSQSDVRKGLAGSGALIKQEVADRIFIVESAALLSPQTLEGVSDVYVGPVPIDRLKSLGTLGIAAGLAWNKGHASNLNRVQAQSVSIATPPEPPTGFSAERDGRDWVLSWHAVYGAVLYEVQMAGDNAFSDENVSAVSATDSITLPGTGDFEAVYFRLRAVGENENADGAASPSSPWVVISKPNPDSVPRPMDLPRPTLLSPANGDDIEGFNVILEFSGFAGRARLQVGRTPDLDSPDIDVVLTSGEWALPSPFLRLGSRYYWRLRTWNDQTSSWTEPRTFRIREPRHVGPDVFINPEARR